LLQVTGQMLVGVICKLNLASICGEMPQARPWVDVRP